MKTVLIHGSGHRADSWKETAARLEGQGDILCPELSVILHGKEASCPNLCAAFAEYCNSLEGPLHLCGLSLGGILALEYALAFPEKVKTLVLIGTPHRVPRLLFGVQNLVFRLLPRSAFRTMAFGKRDTFLLGDSMKTLDFSGRVEAISCPTLLLCGEKDRANLKSARYFKDHIRGAELRILPGAGHIVNEEAPAALAGILNEYYAGHL